MMVVIAYDIRSGSKKLNRVARICSDTGTRVQNSVFEAELNAAQFEALKEKLASAINPAKDSIRFYLLGNHYQSRIEAIGASAVVPDAYVI